MTSIIFYQLSHPLAQNTLALNLVSEFERTYVNKGFLLAQQHRQPLLDHSSPEDILLKQAPSLSMLWG